MSSRTPIRDLPSAKQRNRLLKAKSTDRAKMGDAVSEHGMTLTGYSSTTVIADPDPRSPIHKTAKPFTKDEIYRSNNNGRYHAEAWHDFN